MNSNVTTSSAITVVTTNNATLSSITSSKKPTANMSLFTDFTQIQTTAASVVLSNTTSTINQTIYAALNFTTKTSSVSCDNSISTSVPVPSTTFVIYQNIDFSFSNIFVQVSQNLIVAETVFITLLFFAGII